MKTTFALLTATLLAAASVYAGDKAGGACCSKTTGADGKMGSTFASLNLNAEQETKLKALEADCSKAGCTEESMNKFMTGAKGILSDEQFAKMKASCETSAKEKKQGLNFAVATRSRLSS